MHLRREKHASRSALFDHFEDIEGGGLRASSSYSHEIDERDNDKALNGLQDRVLFLKRLTGDIHEEVENQNRFLDGMGNNMDASRGILSGTVDRFKMVMEMKSSRTMCKLVMLFVGFALIFFYLIRMKVKPRNHIYGLVKTLKGIDLICMRRLQATKDTCHGYSGPEANIDVENQKVNEQHEVQVASSAPTEIQETLYTRILQQVSVYGVAAGYCISASLLSIINKWAVMKFPYPGALTALQYFTSAAGVITFGWFKLIEHDRLDILTLWRFLPAAIIFYLSLFTNSELLLHANVDTFIVFRSAVPIFVAIGETLFLHQPWPSMRTWLSLATIFGGSVLYVLTDYQFTVVAYTWAVAYLVSMTIDFVYIKHIVMTIGLNTWGLVLYNNLEALLLFPLELFIMGELKKIKHGISDDESDWYSFQVVFPVGLSCLFGLSISFFGFSCRRAISATGFTVLGIVNKLLTIVINLVIWDKHSTFIGTVGLLICMIGGVMYQQSTSKPKDTKQINASEREKEEQKLLEMQSNSGSKEVDGSGEN
ncbi:Sugar phosphate transporter domain [Dillenia turbinata]|uniref:Sugar phosphate transporter domain n=1 Tax=Dillenia turbinata TaxID=194707 RepID=A0AAN8VHD6_9MAGN